jgi:UDP-glucose 4-epimerase
MLLVTGACGYIGSHFLHYYLDETVISSDKPADRRVVAVDNLDQGHAEAITAGVKDRVHFYRCNIGDRAAMADILKKHKVDAVVHFAASAYVGESQELPFKYFDNNVLASLAFFEELLAAGVRKIVFSSTCATYGMPESAPIDEKHRQSPINTYGVTKLMVEQALRALALSKGLSYVLLRYFNAAGASPSGLIGERHATETHLIPLALAAASGEGEALKIFGNDYDTPDGTCIRDYIHVDDLASAHLLALKLFEKPEMPAAAALSDSNGLGAAFNLGTAQGNSVLEVLNTIEKIGGKAVPHSFAPRRSGDPSRLFANAGLARSVLGWEPKYDLAGVVETALAWDRAKKF